MSISTKPSIKFSEQRINSIILLKQSVSLMQHVLSALISVQSPLLISVRSLCSDLEIQSVKELIDASINEDCVWAKTPVELRNQRCYAVKKGRNGFLDVARQTYKEATEDVMDVIARLKEEFELQDLEVKFEIARGYYIRIPFESPNGDGQRDRLPETFVNQVLVKHEFIECSTLEILKLNGKLNDALAEIMLMSEQTVEVLVEEIRVHVPALYRASEGIAILDALVSFAHVATSSEKGYVKPIIIEQKRSQREDDSMTAGSLAETDFAEDEEDGGAVLALKNSRHPVKELVMAKKGMPFMENDVYASSQTSRFQIITGSMLHFCRI